MSFTPRPILTIQDTFLTALANADVNLNLDYFQGSILYTLARAISATQLRQDIQLYDLQLASSLVTATGLALDRIASTLNLVRINPTLAIGVVSLRSLSGTVVIPASTVLTDLASGNQFSTNSQISVSTSLDSTVVVTALLSGSSSNLIAGTLLFSESYPNVLIYVGTRAPIGYVGDLTGGSAAENDSSYKGRILTYLTSAGSCSKSALELKLLSYPNVSRGYALTRVPGFVEIWVDSLLALSALQIADLLIYIKPFVAAGIIPIVSQAKRKLANFTIKVVPFSLDQTDLSVLSSQLFDLVQARFEQLSLGETVLIESIVSAVSPLVRSVTVSLPTAPYLVGLDELLILNDLQITYPTA